MSNYKTIKPSLYQFKTELILATITLPIGVGLLLFGYVFLRLRRSRWEIYADSIKIIEGSVERVANIPEMISLGYAQTEKQKKYAIGDLKLQLHDGEQSVYELKGIKNGDIYADAIQTAIHVFKEKSRPKITVRPQEHTDLAVGGLDRMNDLVGLWQAGMISDEDFYREQEKFKNS